MQTRYLRKSEKPAIPVFPRDRGPRLVAETEGFEIALGAISGN